ncbi:MAG: OsmC family protein [Thermoplasmata archaeon]|nr:MAG: OsmC family protein [Thermoplasmata archaeon]
MKEHEKKEEIKIVKAHVKVFWEGGVKTNSMMRGFEVVADAPKWKYGTNTAPAPGELFLTSLGACFTSTFTKCAQELAIILDDVTTDVRAKIDHEMSGRERFVKITMELSAFADEKYKKELKKCFEMAKMRCPLTNAVKTELEISYKFRKV